MNKTNMRIGIYLALFLLTAQEALIASEKAQLYFVGVAGELLEGQRTVFLRWYSFGAAVPVDEYIIYRKSGRPGDPGDVEPISVTHKLRNAPLIRTIFEQPRAHRAKTHIQDALARMCDCSISDATYVEELLKILEEAEYDGRQKFRANLLINSNYGAAIVEGQGYLDAVDPGVYTYELRAVNNSGAEFVLGRITVDATKPTKLAPPTQPEQVEMTDEKGDRVIHLFWDFSGDLRDQRTAFFGYNVYRGDGDLSGEDFQSLRSRGVIEQINTLPILPPSDQALGDSPEDRYVFVDDNRDITSDGPKGDPFIPGDLYTYWAAPIDLLGQEGEASLPVVAMVYDKLSPAVPRGLHTRVVDAPSGRRILLEWDRNEDDAVEYKIYRFRRYDHVGFTDPFPPIDGLTEGFVSFVPQTASGNPFYLDSDILPESHENMAFWYCASAVDGWGNESGMSPPVRGVIFDTTPPDSPGDVLICTTSFQCALELDRIEEAGDLRATIYGDVVVEMVVHGVTRDFRDCRIEIDRVREVFSVSHPTTRTSETIYNGYLDRKDPWIFRDEFPKPDADTRIYYLIRVYCQNQKMPCGELMAPSVNLLGEFENSLQEGKSLRVHLILSAEKEIQCEPGSTDITTHDPFDEDGFPTPVVFVVNQVGDAAGVVLYRSPGCDKFIRVKEQRFEEGEASMELADEYYPEQGGRVCYGLRYFDENHNLSPIHYIPTQVVFASLNVSRIIPSMVAAVPQGDDLHPRIGLKWFAANRGVAGFRIDFASTEDFSVNLGSVHLTRDEYAFNDRNSEFTTILSAVDDLSEMPVDIGATYFIRAAALAENGEESVSNNHLRFVWSARIPEPHDHPDWPVRPLPETESTLLAGWLAPGARAMTAGDPFNYGAVVCIGILTKTTVDNDLLFDIEPPFLLYRRRVDIPDQPYVQISPLIEHIEKSEGDPPADPFFVSAMGVMVPEMPSSMGNTTCVFYLDRVNLIYQAKYEYKIVQLDSRTLEISKVYGPSNSVEVKDR
ncbi:MAG: hypothetical protein JXR73_20330 [Candidatus Omnitrophica bacterium]|nr:hypothetical protein [Candidatus Omnitrophota bacterium]